MWGFLAFQVGSVPIQSFCYESSSVGPTSFSGHISIPVTYPRPRPNPLPVTGAHSPRVALERHLPSLQLACSARLETAAPSRPQTQAPACRPVLLPPPCPCPPPACPPPPRHHLPGREEPIDEGLGREESLPLSGNGNGSCESRFGS